MNIQRIKDSQKQIQIVIKTNLMKQSHLQKYQSKLKNEIQPNNQQEIEVFLAKIQNSLEKINNLNFQRNQSSDKNRNKDINLIQKYLQQENLSNKKSLSESQFSQIKQIFMSQQCSNQIINNLDKKSEKKQIFQQQKAIQKINFNFCQIEIKSNNHKSAIQKKELQNEQKQSEVNKQRSQELKQQILEREKNKILLNTQIEIVKERQIQIKKLIDQNQFLNKKYQKVIEQNNELKNLMDLKQKDRYQFECQARVYKLKIKQLQKEYSKLKKQAIDQKQKYNPIVGEEIISNIFKENQKLVDTIEKNKRRFNEYINSSKNLKLQLANAEQKLFQVQKQMKMKEEIIKKQDGYIIELQETIKQIKQQTNFEPRQLQITKKYEGIISKLQQKMNWIKNDEQKYLSQNKNLRLFIQEQLSRFQIKKDCFQQLFLKNQKVKKNVLEYFEQTDLQIILQAKLKQKQIYQDISQISKILLQTIKKVD